MDIARRAKLASRQRLLKLRLKRAAESREFRLISARLRALKIQHSKITPHGCATALGRLIAGPAQDERLLWNNVYGAIVRTWTLKEERDELVRRALADVTCPRERVAVIWHSVEAGLRIRSDRLADAIGTVFSDLGETIWIVAADGGPWLIEISRSDREVCWASAMHGPDPHVR